jgi:hypothetical protein
MKSLLVVGLVLVVVSVGCQQPSQRLNSPPQGDTVNRSPMQEPYQAMVDNSLLADMSIADIHFAGATTRLSGTGEYRLSRLVEVCKAYGGEIRYDTQLLDEQLVQQRLQRVQDYLAAAGCDMDKCSARLGMAATATTPAAQAAKAQAALDGDSSGGSQGLMPKLPRGNGAGAAK